ncbi:kelch repeat-containing protein [Sphingomonas sp.]|uniref:kelch repeat-containing protein n=1 Tax=Sphingomonas sp. TaxID=28214 RepID=UPI003D6CDFB4
MTDEAKAPISAKLGDYATFKADMLALIPRVVVDTGGGAVTRPLARLNLGVPTDPTLAMVDAFAALADIVSFYQDRVLSEGYLGTAIDYSSLVLLGRSIGETAGAYIGATAEIALFAQPGAPVTVPEGAAIQANPPKPSGSTSGANSAKAAAASDAASTAISPIFETAAQVVVNPALNQLTPLQTRPVYLDPDTDSLLISGTGLGLAVGDFMLFVRRGNPTQWLRLTVFAVSENHVLSTTTISIGSSLQAQWTASGATEALPHDAGEGLELYALDLTCRLFGYNAPSWSSQSAAVQRANTPTGMSPAEFTEWPGFGIDLDDLDLQAVYTKVLPGSQFLLETPENNTLGVIASVSRQNISEFGLTGQVTQVTLELDPAVLPSGVALIPARNGVTASLLGDGRVLLAGGIGEDGVLDSVEVYDPVTGLVSQVATLPSKRGLHTATTINGVVYLVGGVTGDWEFATDILQLDPKTLTFSAIQDIPPAVPRIGHAATALPDGTLMLSGGLTGDSSKIYPTLKALLEDSIATNSVVVFAPGPVGWAWEAQMQHARAGHSATLCPVVKTTADGGSASVPPVGQIVVFLGGHDGGAMPPGFTGASTTARIWDDAEVTDPTDWKPVPGLYPIKAATGGATGSPRYDHVATPLPGNDGFLITGGQSATGPVLDNWLVGAFAHYAGAGASDFAGVPVFVSAPPLIAARSNHAAAQLQGGKVVVAGGVSGSTVLASVEIFSVSAGISIPFDGVRVLGPSLAGAALPQRQAYAAFLALPGDELLVAGGLDTIPDGFLNAVVAYDADVGTFITFPGPILTTAYTLAPVGSIALPDGTILILGSTMPDPFPFSAKSMTGFAWTFDPTTNLSTITGAPGAARIGATLSLLANGTILVAGGMGLTDDGYAVLDTAEIYDPKSRSFRPIHNKLTVPRCGHTATVLADGTVLLAGGYSYPAVTYEPYGVLATWVPALDNAETFSVAQQAFTAVATTLPFGFAFHSATRLASGDVLIAGGVTDFYTERDFTSVTAFPSTQAAVFNVAAQAFAVIAPLGTARAMHSATLLGSGAVLIVGGVVTSDMQATATTELFDPGSYTFAPSTSIAEPRHSQGAILLPAGLLLIGGASAPSYELIPADGTGGETVYPLPFPLPSPGYPLFVSLSETVTPIPVAGRGVYAFGGQVDPNGMSSCSAILYVDAPPTPDSSARRQAMVYTQSRQLYLAPPIDNRPLTGAAIVLTGLIDEIAVGHTLLTAGNPPLAATVGDVTGIGGTPKLDPGTIIMVLAPVPSATGNWWRADVPDTGELSIEVDLGGDPPSGLRYLSGNGSTIGNVTSQQLQLFTRPVQSEAVLVKAVQQYAATNTTVLTLDQPLRYLYDRTTTSVYGNVTEVTQGSTVNELLGSGDGQKPFLRFILKQAPLTWLEQADGSIAPQLTVTVNGAAWQYVEALGDCTPDARVYQLIQDAQGRAQIQFGDGIHGLRPPTGQNNITATYRVGAGTGGNVPAGSLTRPPNSVPGIKGVLNPVAATGGIGAPPRSSLRGQIPIGVADLGRIVTQDDMLTFIVNRPEVSTATLSTVRAVGQTAGQISLVTLAGLDNAVPDMASPTFVSLQAAFNRALASSAALQHLLLPYEPLPFKVAGTFTVVGTPDLQQVESAIATVLQSTYDIAMMNFGQSVRATDICAVILKNVAEIKTVTVTNLWAPTETKPTPPPSPPSSSPALMIIEPITPAPTAQVLHPKKARRDPPTGAQILFLSTDADAVAFTLDSPPPPPPPPAPPAPASVSGEPAS